MSRYIRAKTKQPIQLIKAIASGGQGVIWTTNQPGLVAKIYSKPLSRQEIEKLQVMVDYPPTDPMQRQGQISIAWCTDLLKNELGTHVGYLMPHIQESQDIFNVYLPAQRLKIAPWFDWRYLYTTARNIATVVQAVHDKQYVIGDIKPNNFRVTSDARVAIVDTDSFQIRHPRTGKILYCPVGSREFTPPELIGKPFDRLERLQTHDRFGLGIIIFLLLFGYHPYLNHFTGAEHLSIEERIRQGYWINSTKVKPGKFAIPLEVLHPEIRTCFHQCFTLGHQNPSLRPTAATWRKALDVAIQDLVQCKHNPQHWHSQSAKRCPWCDRSTQIQQDIFPLQGSHLRTGTPTPSLSSIPSWQSVPSEWKELSVSAATLVGSLVGGVLLISQFLHFLNR